MILAMNGPNANALFLKKISPIAKKPWLFLYSKFLSSGCIGYYIKENEWQTRIFLHNYFALLNDGLFPAHWEIVFFSRDGKKQTKLNGVFSGSETAIIDLKDVSGLDNYGVTWVKINMNSKTVASSEAYSSVFFSEYYVPNTKKSVIAHSLSGTFKASHHNFSHTGTSFITPKGFTSHLYIANSCNFHAWGHSACGDCSITFINHRGQKLGAFVKNIPAHGCQRLDLQAMVSGLMEHFEDKPYVMEVSGKNLLAIPFLFQTNGTVVLAEHL